MYSLILTLWMSGAGMAQAYTIMTWNSLNFSTSPSAQERIPYFRMILDSIRPDILVMQEIHNQAGADYFHSAVLEYSMAMAPFVDGSFTDNALYYNASVFEAIENIPIHTGLRDISQFVLVQLNTTDTLRIFSLHLKAGKEATGRERRSQEVDILRNVTDALGSQAYFMVCGDFNFYGSTEPAYLRLLEDDGNTGYFIDPLEMSGTWSKPEYAQYHTQSTRTRSFGGGATGGLDDRFDLILFGPRFFDSDAAITYEVNSTRAVGNEGQVYNDSINFTSNTTISAQLANALHHASDHLPVLANIEFRTAVDAPAPLSKLAPRVYPNPSIGLYTIKPATNKVTGISVLDAMGRTVLEYRISGDHFLDIGHLPDGMYFLKLQNDSGEKVFKLLKY